MSKNTDNQAIAQQDKVVQVTVLNKTTWTPTLFSFTVTRPQSFKFTAGQFVRLGIVPCQLQYYKKSIDNEQQSALADDKEDTDTTGAVREDIGTALDAASVSLASNEEVSAGVFRPYSIVSSPYDDHLEFFSIVIENGAFTSQLQHLQVGDKLLLDTTPFGFLTLARYQKPAPKELWLLATGTGIAPFLSMLQDLKTWEDYEHIVLAYSARYHNELAYKEAIMQLQADFGSLVDHPAKLTFIPIITREVVENTLNERLPTLLTKGILEEKAGLKLTPEHSHVMLCGNPQMVDDTKEALKQMGLVMNRRGEGNIAVENYW